MTPQSEAPQHAGEQTGGAATRPPVGAPADDALARRSIKRRARMAQVAIPLVLIALMVIFQLKNDQFLSGGNLETILESAALPAIVACGLTIVLILGQFDLSFQAVAGLATTTTAALLVMSGVPVLVALLIVIAMGVFIGVVNGVLVARFGLAALVVTIAVGSLLNGTEFAITGSKPVAGIPVGFTEFARSKVIGIPALVLIAALVGLVLWYVVDKTPFGREVRAVGSNIDAARFAGVNVVRVTIIGFVIVAVCAAFAGFLYTGRQGVIYPLTGLQLLLPSFAACFLGASMFRIGQFNIPGTIIGVLMAQVVINGLLLAGVADYATYFFQGFILIAAILFARFVSGGLSER